MLKHIGILLLTLAFAIGARAATVLSGHHITIRDGLPSNHVNDMVQDSQGFVWMATAGGLCRYDGYSFVTYPVVGTGSGATGSAVGTLHLDERNQLLWMRTATFGYACYDLRRGCFADYAAGCDARKTFQRFRAAADGIWMFDPLSGIRHAGCSGATFSCHDYDCSQMGRIAGLTVDKAGRAWVTAERGIFRLDAQGRARCILRSANIIGGTAWGDRCLFLTRKGGIMAYSLQGKRIKTVAGTEPVVMKGSFVWQDKWVILTPQGIMTIDSRTLAMQKRRDTGIEGGLLLDETDGNFMVSDAKGTLWMFPAKGEPRAFTLLQGNGTQTGRRRNYSTVKADDGMFYITTYGNGLFVYDPQTGQTTHYSASDATPILMTDNLVNVHAFGGSIWVGQEDAGLACLSHRYMPKVSHLVPDASGSDRNYNYITGMTMQPDGRVLLITRSSRTYTYDPLSGGISQNKEPKSAHVAVTDAWGRTWHATWEHGLLVRTEKYGHGFLKRSTAESRINDLAIDHANRLWVATYNGLYVADLRNKKFTDASFRRYGEGSGLPGNNITCLRTARDGSVWLACEGTGLARCEMDKEGNLKYRMVSRAQGLAYNTIHSLAEDKEGRMWAGSEGYLSCVTKDMRVRNFPMQGSLLSGLCSDRCALALPDGRLLFGTHDGLQVMEADEAGNNTKTKTKTKTMPARLTSIDINGKPISLFPEYAEALLAGTGVTLSSTENSLTLHYSNFNFDPTAGTAYQYYLEGFDKDWREPTTQSSVDYGNLPPGRYVFHVRLADGTGETTCTVTIRQPWYNTLWAWLVYILAAASAGYVVYRHKREQFRLRQQMKVEKEVAEFRTNFFTQVAHEFRTPLSIISGAVDKIGEHDGTPRKPVQTAQRGVKRLMQLVNQLMEFRKINSGNMRLHVEPVDAASLVQEVCQDFWTTAKNKEQSLLFLPSDKHLPVMADRHIVDTIAYNLISNALKYTPQHGTIEVRLRHDDNSLLLTVDDSGQGISNDRLQQLFKPFMHGYASQGGMGIGLYTARQMAQAHGGTLDYSKSGRLGGACFTLAIPCDIADSIETTPTNQHAAASVPHIIKEMPPVPLNGQRIAIIEDDPDMMEQIKTEVGTYFVVDGFANGSEALERLKTEDFSLLICDVMLPDMSGFDIVRQLRNDSRTSHLPVIMLTALDDENHQIKGYQAGADDYMTKPCNYRILIARIIQLIKWREESKRNKEALGSSESLKSLGTLESPGIITSQADKNFLDRVNIIVGQHISDPDFTIDRMAEIMHVGRTKLYGKIKELTGQSPNKLFMSERMRIAAELLRDGELNISEIACRVGITDASYFNKLFKQHYGMTPSKYRESE